MPRKADAQEYLRFLAVARVSEGYKKAEVARFLGVSERSVRRWVAGACSEGDAALVAHLHTGRPPKLDEDQAVVVTSWLSKSPGEFGFPTQRWTAPRVAQLIQRELGVRMNPRYLNDWLARHGITPQIPARVAQERDEAEIERWVRMVWPRIKKKHVSPAQTLFLPMKAGS